MKLTIDNHDGKGAIDYTSAIVAARPFRILRRLNEPVTCAVTLLPADSLPTPARSGRIRVYDDSSLLLFTGYIATEPALELAGQGSSGAVYAAVVTAISDDILLSRQYLPQTNTPASAADQALQVLLARMELAGIIAQIPQDLPASSGFQVDTAHTWAENVGALATAIRNAWRLMDGTLTIAPVGNVTHNLSEAQGTLSLSNFQISLLKALANDVTVCGEIEPCAYVTEYFQGDGATVLFNLTEEPYTQPASQQKPLTDTFSDSAINPQLWMVDSPGAYISLTSNGLTCAGGNGQLGVTMVSAVSDLELGGSLVIEAANVQFGTQTSGILNGLFGGGGPTLPNCFLGFQIAQANGATSLTALVNGTAAGTPFAPVAGHWYTLRLRFYATELQRLQQTYYVTGDPSGIAAFGGLDVDSPGSALLEVQDVTNGVAGAPLVLWSGSLPIVPPTCSFIPLNSSYLQCSIGSITVEQQGPQWVTSTPPNGTPPDTPIVRRIGAAAQGADCTLDTARPSQVLPRQHPAVRRGHRSQLPHPPPRGRAPRERRQHRHRKPGRPAARHRLLDGLRHQSARAQLRRLRKRRLRHALRRHQPRRRVDRQIHRVESRAAGRHLARRHPRRLLGIRRRHCESDRPRRADRPHPVCPRLSRSTPSLSRTTGPKSSPSKRPPAFPPTRGCRSSRRPPRRWPA